MNQLILERKHFVTLFFCFVTFANFRSSSPDSMNTDRNDKSGSGLSSALYKLLVPLLRCEVVDIRDAAVSALGSINHDALK